MGGCMLMNSEGGPPFRGCMLMNSKVGSPIHIGGPPLGTISIDLVLLAPQMIVLSTASEAASTRLE